MSTALDIVFAGTPEFSVPPLAALLGSKHRVIAVYTQPDRPAGRGRKITASPVKRLALERRVPVLQPRSFKSEEANIALESLAPDLMVVSAYGLLLPPRVLQVPRLGCVNIHASLLPRWRGAAPIQRALLAGDTETGVTIMQMDEGLDTGPMLHRLVCRIRPDDTAGSLHDRLSEMGARALMEILPVIAGGTTQPEAQDSSQAVYARKLEKAEAEIDWMRPAVELERQVRAFNPWPVAQTSYRGQHLRIWSARALPHLGSETPGDVIGGGREGIDVASGEGILRIEILQLPGKRALAAADFMNAHHVKGWHLG